MDRLKPVIRERIGTDERVQVSTLPGKTVRPVFDKAKLQVWETMEERNLVAIAVGRNDVLSRRTGGIARKIEKGINELRQVSQDVQIAVYTVPEVARRGFHLERAIVEVNSELRQLSKALEFAAVDIKREVRNAGRELDFVRDGVHFSQRLSLAVARRLAARAVAFYGAHGRSTSWSR